MKNLRKDCAGNNPHTEYAVYIFQNPSQDSDAHNCVWEKKHTTTNKKGALRRAGALHRSNQYRRVEVKRRYFDPANDTHLQSTLKVYDDIESLEKSRIMMAFSGLLALALLSAAMFYFLI